MNIKFHTNLFKIFCVLGERRATPINNSIVVAEASTTSLDEIVIKSRGRRSLPVKWSPIPIESPQKVSLDMLNRKSPKKGLIALRSSPRKRLQLNDPSPADLLHSRKVIKLIVCINKF